MNESNHASLTIDKLNIRLPAGFEKRADSIARNLSKQLAKIDIPIEGKRDIASLDIGNFKVHAGEANSLIARRLATSIADKLQGTQANTNKGAGPNVG